MLYCAIFTNSLTETIRNMGITLREHRAAHKNACRHTAVDVTLMRSLSSRSGQSDTHVA
jgi:hypothetical protein